MPLSRMMSGTRKATGVLNLGLEPWGTYMTPKWGSRIRECVCEQILACIPSHLMIRTQIISMLCFSEKENPFSLLEMKISVFFT